MAQFRAGRRDPSLWRRGAPGAWIALSAVLGGVLVACAGSPGGVADTTLDPAGESIDLPKAELDWPVADAGDPGPQSPADPGGDRVDASDLPTAVTDAAGLEIVIDAASGLTVATVEPAEGPAGQSTSVTVRGTGFVDGMEVFFGTRKGQVPFVLTPKIVNVTVPPGDAGVVDVRVVLPDGTAAVLPRGFLYLGSLTLTGVDPATGPSGGGTPVTIRGAGFLDGPIFLFGGREAPVVRVVDDGTALVVTPPGLPGPVPLVALLGNGSARLEDGFTFLPEPTLPSGDGLAVTSCSPSSGPPEGGTPLTIVGQGFRPGASVRVGALPALDVTVVSDSMITARTSPGSPGPARILVLQGSGGVWLDGAFEYASPGGPAILAVDPDEGAWAGGTLVRVEGRNLAGVRKVFIGGGEATDVRVVSSVRVELRTPHASESGPVPVMVVGDGADLGATYTYFDPYLPGGGTWGGPARDSLNVTVTDGSTGKRLEDAYVIVGDDPHTRFQGRTDGRGQITLSDAGLRGPLVVTAGKEAYTASTIAGFDARNVTLSISPAASPESPGTPPGTVGGKSICTVRGRVKDYGKYLVKPSWVEGTPYVQCGTSSPSLFGGAMDPGPGSFPDAEGRFEILARPGIFGVQCQMMVADPSKGWAVPLRMGLVRRVSCKGGDVVEGITVSLDVETDAELWVATSTPPAYSQGAGSPVFMGGWELGEDGWLSLFQRYVRKATRTLFVSQPRSFDPPLDGPGYSFYVTSSAATPNGIPYSSVLAMGVPAVGPWPVLLEDGQGFEALPTGLRRQITAMIPVEGGHALAADAGGGTWEFDGTAFQVGPYRTSRALYGLSGGSPSDFWVVGARGLARHIVNGQATDVPAPVTSDFLGVSSDGAGGVSVAAGPLLLRLSGDHLVQEALPTGSDARAVIRFPTGEVVAAGAGGAILTGRSGDVFGVVRPIARDLRAIAGTDRDEVWIVGDGGAVIRVGRDDVTAVIAPGEPDLAGVVVLGPSNILAFGPGGTILHYDGTHFTDRSRPDLDVDLMAGASAGGRVVLAGRHYAEVPRFLPFPEVLSPADGSAWDGRDMSWFLGGVHPDPSFAQAIFSNANGSAFWIVMAGGDVRQVSLPDLAHALGKGPLPAGTRRMNLTVVRTPGFDINGYGYQALDFYDREAFSVALTVFH